MIETLAQHRPGIAAAVEQVIEEASGHLGRVSAWGPDFSRRLLDFALRGKMIRGSLVAVGAGVFGCEPNDDIYRIAAAVELVQSFLLIHDDIMDEDRVRRGEATVYEQYRRLADERTYKRADRFGESMGICAGDVAMMICFEGLLSISFASDTKLELMRLVSREIADVGIAQMADVANGHTSETTGEQEIRAVYRYKTGRYTFSLPLMLGALVAGAPPDQVDILSRWGELQGIIFQIRDDQLGLMEDGVDTGKPAGSDITADKQTLHRLRLFSAAPGSRYEPVLAYFGQPVTPGELEEVREALQELGVLKEIDSEVEGLGRESDTLLSGMTDLDPDGAKVLAAIARYNRDRTR